MSSRVLVDSNVLLDLVTSDPDWNEWSGNALARARNEGTVAINQIVYAEVSVHFNRVEQLDAAVTAAEIERLDLPWVAAFLGGKSFLAYRRAGGARTSPLPDFYIGAHAAIAEMTLLTRDPRRYRTYFPRLELIAP